MLALIFMIRGDIFIYTALTVLELASELARELGQTSLGKLSVRCKKDKRQDTLQWILFSVNWEELHAEMMHNIVSELYSTKL